MTISKVLFVIGTGTEVGKTYVSGLILRALTSAGLQAGYFKAAMSGNLRDEAGHLIPGDARQVQRMAHLKQSEKDMCPYVYEAAVSPHLAGRMEGRAVDEGTVMAALAAVRAEYDYVLIEGSGGIFCPLRVDGADRYDLPDFIRAVGAPLLLVADAGLGTINQVVLTQAYLVSQGFQLAGLVLNRFDDADLLHQNNLAECISLIHPPLTCTVPADSDDLSVDPAALISCFK